MSSIRTVTPSPDASAAWDPEHLALIGRWFTNAAQRSAGITYASGGVLDRDLSKLIRQDVDAVAAAYGEQIHKTISVVYRVGADGIPWSRPSALDARNGHRRRVVALMAVNDGIGGDLELRLKANGDILTPLPAPGEIVGARAVDEWQLTPTEVDLGPRLWLVTIGVSR